MTHPLDKSDDADSQATERLLATYAVEHRAAEVHSHDINIGHFEKLSVLQAGVLALSVTFLAGVGSQAATRQATVVHVRVLIACWVSLLFSILFCVIHNWLSAKGLGALNSVWSWSDQKSALKYVSKPPRSLTLAAILSKAGILDEWQREAVQTFVRLDRVNRFLEYVIHILFFTALLCLAIFGIANVAVFIR